MAKAVGVGHGTTTISVVAVEDRWSTVIPDAEGSRSWSTHTPEPEPALRRARPSPRAPSTDAPQPR